MVNKFWQAFRSLLLRRCGAAAAVLLVSCLSHRIGPLFGGLGPSPCFTCALLCFCVALGVCPFVAWLVFPFSPHHFGTFVLLYFPLGVRLSRVVHEVCLSLRVRELHRSDTSP